MKLTVSWSKNSETYYIQKSYRIDSGKNSTKTVERLGSMKELQARFGEEDTLAKVKECVSELSAAEKESRKEILIRLSPSVYSRRMSSIVFIEVIFFYRKSIMSLALAGYAVLSAGLIKMSIICLWTFILKNEK